MVSFLSLRTQICFLILIGYSTVSFSIKPQPELSAHSDSSWWENFLTDIPGKKRKVLNVPLYNSWLKKFIQNHQETFQASMIGIDDQTEIFKLESKPPSTQDGTKIRVFLGSGVHGKEEMGPLIVRKILEEITRNKELLKEFQFTFIPLINAYGQKNALRGTRQTNDLNRSFGENSWVSTSTIVSTALKQSRFDVAIDLHGKRTSTGFFFIRGKEDHGIAAEALRIVPSDIIMQSRTGNYPGYRGSSDHKDPKRYLLSSQGVATSQNPNTFKSFLGTLGHPFTYTMEYPGLQPAKIQIDSTAALFFEIIKATKNFQNSKAQNL